MYQSIQNKYLMTQKNKRQMTEHSWLDNELQSSNFPDQRLRARFLTLIKQLWSGVGKTIPLACEDWANTKAAYRFFSSERITETEILNGHFQSTKKRFTESKKLALVLHDTSEFSYKSANPEKIGITKSIPCGKKLNGKPILYTKCGILMHSSLVVTPEGLPLGLSAIKFWTRKQFKGTNALKKHINTTRISIEKKESYRWLENIKTTNALLNSSQYCVHIGDRESDIYELFCQCQELDTHFLVRTCVDRLAGEGHHTIKKEIEAIKIKCLHTVNIVDKKGLYSQVKLALKYKQILILPPVDKQKKYPKLTLNVLHAVEKDPPKDRKRIVWKLITDLPIKTKQDAIEKLDWYAMRWKIETFHKILKSGCRVEECKLRAAERLSKFIAMFCILGWRIFWLTQINRCIDKAPSQLAFTGLEIKILEKLIPDKKVTKKRKYLSDYVIKLARLGGYLDRNSDPPPGNMVMWRGLTRLTDIQLGMSIAGDICG